jgi:hypothetical protein
MLPVEVRLCLRMLTSFPLEIRTVTSNSNSVLIEDVDGRRRKTLSDSARGEDPETVQDEHSDETSDSVKCPDSDTGLEKGQRAATEGVRLTGLR